MRKGQRGTVKKKRNGPLPAWKHQEVERLVLEGKTESAIMAIAGVSNSVVLRIRDRLVAEGRVERKASGSGSSAAFKIAVRHQAERLMEDVPADTRNLTQRIMGDPLPGRSALDRRG